MARFGNRPWDDAVFVAGCAYVLLLLFLVLRRLPKLRSQTAQLLHGLGARLGKLRRRSLRTPPEAKSSVVHAKLLERKVQQYTHFVRALCGLLWVRVLVTNRVILSGSARNLTPQQDCVVLAGQFGSALFAFWPGAATATAMDVHYCLTALAMAFFPLASTADTVMVTILLANTIMIFVNGFRRVVATRTLPIFALSNLAFAVGAAAALSMHAGSMLLAFGQVFLVMSSAGLAVLLESGLRATMLQNLEFQAVQELYAAACALLRTCCDVVVELDSRGVIVSADELGSFLLQQGLRNFEGEPLADLLLQDDQRLLFLERLRQPKMRRVGLAETLAVTMRDGCGNVLSLELLWFDYRQVDGQLRYMLGLRNLDKELGERIQELPRMTSPGSSVPRLSSKNSSDSIGTPPAVTASGSLREDSGDHTPTSVEAASVVVDISQHGLPVRWVSPAFQAQLGRLPLHRPFLRHVRYRGRFVAWLTEFFDKDAPGTETDAAAAGDVSRHLRLALDLPSGRVSVVCRVPRPGEWPVEAKVAKEGQCVCLLFSGVAREGCSRRKGSSERARSRAAGTPPAVTPVVAQTAPVVTETGVTVNHCSVSL